MFIQPGQPASPGPWGGLDYHSVNWCNYNCNTWLRRSRPAVCLHSTATTRKLYLKRIEVFFLIVVVNNGDLSSFKKQNVSYPFHGGCRYLIRLSWHVSVTHSHSWVKKSLVRVTVWPRTQKWSRQGWNSGLFSIPPMRPFHNGNWTEWRALGSDIIVTFSKSSRRESLISEKNGITRDLLTLLCFIHFESAKLIIQIQY